MLYSDVRFTLAQSPAFASELRWEWLKQVDLDLGLGARRGSRRGGGGRHVVCASSQSLSATSGTAPSGWDDGAKPVRRGLLESPHGRTVKDALHN